MRKLLGGAETTLTASDSLQSVSGFWFLMENPGCLVIEEDNKCRSQIAAEKMVISDMAAFELYDLKPQKNHKDKFLLIFLFLYVTLLTGGFVYLAYNGSAHQKEFSAFREGFCNLRCPEGPQNRGAFFGGTEGSTMGSDVEEEIHSLNTTSLSAGTWMIGLEQEIRLIHVKNTELNMRINNITFSAGRPGSDGRPGERGAPGNPGAKGGTGERGLPGQKGEEGSSGKLGPPGLPGHQGPTGQIGLPGTDGIKGEPGNRGQDGEKGAVGAAGPPGAQGPKGSKGETGINGAAGSPGIPGRNGEKGQKGDTGSPSQRRDEGTIGKVGPPGPAGPAGRDGVKGEAGRPGQDGQTGATGSSGVPGNPGLQGATGQKGSKGDAGIRGASGSPGIPGSNGQKGETGLKGDIGQKGNSGTPGVNGLQGTKGESGRSGFPGAKGEKGSPGLQGAPGVPGQNSHPGSDIVRIVGGAKGRVEIKRNGEWGTICDDSWDSNDGKVICRMLGYSRVVSTFTASAGVGKIFLDDVQCTGSEQSILDCIKSETHNCSHSEDAGVECA